MILSTILNFARAQAQTDSNGLTDANGIIFANEALQDLHRKLVAAGIDASQIQEVYRDTAIGSGTYIYPSDMLALKTIELNYNDTDPSNYKTATQVDVANLNNASSFSWLRVNADPNNPLFDDRGDWFEIFPTPTGNVNTSQAIRLIYFLQPTEYITTGDTVSYPESLDTAFLGWRIAASYLYSLGNIPQGDAFNAKYDQRIRDYIELLGRGSQQPLRPSGLHITGFEF